MRTYGTMGKATYRATSAGTYECRCGAVANRVDDFQHGAGCTVTMPHGPADIYDEERAAQMPGEAQAGTWSPYVSDEDLAAVKARHDATGRSSGEAVDDSLAQANRALYALRKIACEARPDYIIDPLVADVRMGLRSETADQFTRKAGE